MPKPIVMEQERETDEIRRHNAFIRKITEVTDELGIKYDPTIGILYKMFSQLWHGELKKPEAERTRITAKRIVDKFLKAMYGYYGHKMQVYLKDAEIYSGADIGRIISVMCDKQMMRMEPEDKLSDFDNLFTTDDVFSYLMKEGLINKLRRTRYDTVSMGLCIAGALLVLAGYARTLPFSISITGWVLILAGWQVSLWKADIARFLSGFKRPA